MAENKDDKWWGRIPKNHKIFLAAMFLSLIGFTVLISIVTTKNVVESEMEKEYCQNPSCVNAASKMLTSMNLTVNPCEDFHEFVCGRALSTKESRTNEFDSEIKNKIRNILEEQGEENGQRIFAVAKKFYGMCMDEGKIDSSSLAEINNIFAEVSGGWPVVKGNSWPGWNFEWVRTNYKLFHFGISPESLFKFDVDTYKINNGNYYTIQIKNPSFSRGDDVLGANATESDVRNYLNFMVDIAMKFGAKNRKSAETELMEVIKLESKLYRLSENYTNLDKEADEREKIFKMHELQKKFSYVPWLEYSKNFIDMVHLDENENVVVENPAYLENLGKLLKDYPKRVIANMMIWNEVFKLLKYLPKTFREAYHENFDYHHENPRHKWEECAESTAKSLTPIVSSLYVRKYFDEASKTEITKVIDNLKKVMVKKLEVASWIRNEHIRSLVIKKIEGMKQMIGFPSELLNDVALSREYATLDVDSRGYLSSVLKTQRFFLTRKFNKVREEYQFEDWRNHVDPFLFGKTYDRDLNTFEIPATMLDVIFNKNLPKFMNYGTVGGFVGLLLNDVIIDYRGNLNKLWDGGSFDAFSEIRNCFLSQLNDSKDEEDIDYFDSQVQFASALEIAHEAYNQIKDDEDDEEPKLPGFDYSQGQMFWVSAVQKFCFRIEPTEREDKSKTFFNALFLNFPDLVDDFNCPRDASSKKCSVWRDSNA